MPLQGHVGDVVGELILALWLSFIVGDDGLGGAFALAACVFVESNRALRARLLVRRGVGVVILSTGDGSEF
jgi:hypothetical protein